MTTTRARLDTVLTTISAGLLKDAKTAAGDAFLSKAEAKNLDSALLKEGDEAVRMRSGSGKHVVPKEAADAALEVVKRNIARINQTTGAGKALLSRDEIKRLQGVDGETAQRAAKAYELITGKRIVLDGKVPPSPPSPSALPDAEKAAVMDTLVNDFGLARAARVELKDVSAAEGGFKLKIDSNVFSGDAFVKTIDGRTIVAPAPFSDATYRAVKQKALEFFDSDFKPDMRDWGSSTQEIRDARAAWLPMRALLKGEDDPDGLTSDYPLVFTIDNESGSDHGIFCGYDPSTGDGECYAFN